MEHLGVRLKKARERRGWTLRELAQHSQVNHAWIARLESGERHNISLQAGARMAVALGITLDYLAGITTRSKPREDAEEATDTKTPEQAITALRELVGKYFDGVEYDREREDV